MVQNIQALRAVAAYLVVCVHLGDLMVPLGVSETDLRFGGFGVDIFFVISGFIMVATTAGRAVTPAGFMLNRITRIVPLYWCLTLALFAIGLVAPSMLGSTVASLPNLLRSLLFVPYERMDGTIRPLLFLGWTLNYEMFFYLIFAATLVMRSVTARVAAASLVLLVLVVCGQTIESASVAFVFYTSPIIIEFALGMVLGLIFVQTGTRRGPVLLVTGGVAGVLALLTAISGSGLLGGAAPLIAAATCFVALALGLEAKQLIIRWRPIQLMGDASYSLYLVHPFAMQAVAKAGGVIGSDSIAVSLALVACALAAATVAGLGSYWLLERPLTRLVRGKARRAVAPIHAGGL